MADAITILFSYVQVPSFALVVSCWVGVFVLSHICRVHAHGAGVSDDSILTLAVTMLWFVSDGHGGLCYSRTMRKLNAVANTCHVALVVLELRCRSISMVK
jgi:hypothetical protein